MTRDASVLDQVRAGAPSAFTVLEVGGGGFAGIVIADTRDSHRIARWIAG